MSWMQLLAVGKSICNVKDHPSRYKMTRDNLLPIFGSSGDSAELADVPAAVACAVEDPEPKSVAGPPLAEETGGEQNRITTHARQRGRAPAARVTLPRGRWPLIRNPFARKDPEKAAKGPMQSELPWENIQVARNDLNDSDLEVVQSQNVPKTDPEKPATPQPAGRPMLVRLGVLPLWNRIAVRWFRSGKL